MKSKTLLHYVDPPVLAALSGFSIGLAMVIHPIFLLFALVFALVWPVKRLFELMAELGLHHRHT